MYFLKKNIFFVEKGIFFSKNLICSTIDSGDLDLIVVFAELQKLHFPGHPLVINIFIAGKFRYDPAAGK